MRSLASVVRREAARLRRLPALWALLLPIPVAATLLVMGVLSSEVARELPVAVLDLDRTPAAQTATRWLEATRSARITAHVEDLGAARSLLLERTVYAVLVVPRHFERDLLHGRSPHVTLLYNEQAVTAGNLIVGDVVRAASAGATALAVRGQEAAGRTAAAAAAAVAPILVDTHVLFNPGVNYSHALGLLLVGGVLQVVIGLTMVYAIGRELADVTVEEWVAAAGGSPVVAWAGKLVPYTMYDCLLAFALLGAYAAWFQIPVRGQAWLLAVGCVAFVLASQALAVLLIVFTANLGSALGAASILFGPAAAFSGVSFPLGAMPVLARAWAHALPLTHVMMLTRAEISVGAPPGVAARPLLALAAITGIALLLAGRRMGQALRDPALWGRT
ncbi:MAG TPA: ABC transporter permease [Gemmatimonadales bacterium]